MSIAETLVSLSVGESLGFNRATDPFVTEGNQPRYLDDARVLLGGELRALGLTRKFANGRLTRSETHRLLERLILSGRSELRGIIDMLASNAISLARWFRSTLTNAVGRFYASTLGLLGIGTLGTLGAVEPRASELNVLRDQANFHVAHLVRFREQLRTGEQLLDGTAANRATMYADAAWSVAHNVQRSKMITDGYMFERRRLGIADHCAGCIDQAAYGWVPVGTLLPIGQTQCMSLCHCYYQWRREMLLT